jgi:hypothetical protein
MITTIINELNKIEKSAILAGFIGAIISFIITMAGKWFEKRNDLNLKRKLIITDLDDKKTLLIKVNKEYQSLLRQFEDQNLDSHNSDDLTNLNTDLFNSISKTDLFKIYQKKIGKLINIYNTIDFLSRKKPLSIYQEFIKKQSQFNFNKNVYLSNPQRYNQTFIDNSINQIKANILTCSELNNEIEAIMKK